MEGKELFRLLDFVKKLREEQDKLEKEASGKIGAEKVEPNSKASVYKAIAIELEKILRDLNRYNL